MEYDLQSFRLVLTDFLDIRTASNRLKALEAASYVTNTTRAVRLYITSNHKIAIDSYILIAKPQDFTLYLNRQVNIILLARKDYLARMDS
jgi:hypothetical protein